jgi:hypothetical protein
MQNWGLNVSRIGYLVRNLLKLSSHAGFLVDFHQLLMDYRLVILEQLFELFGIGLRAVTETKECGIDHGLLLKDRRPQFFDAGLDLLKDVKDWFNVRFHAYGLHSMTHFNDRQAVPCGNNSPELKIQTASNWLVKIKRAKAWIIK